MGGFTVPNQVMGLVNQTSGVLLSGQSAGLLGLAFKVRGSDRRRVNCCLSNNLVIDLVLVEHGVYSVLGGSGVERTVV